MTYPLYPISKLEKDFKILTGLVRGVHELPTLSGRCRSPSHFDYLFLLLFHLMKLDKRKNVTSAIS